MPKIYPVIFLPIHEHLQVRYKILDRIAQSSGHCSQSAQVFDVQIIENEGQLFTI